MRMKLKILLPGLQSWLLATMAAIFLSAATAFAGGAVYLLQADGLSCPFCAYGIEKQLGRISGVESVTADIANGSVRVVMKEGTNLDRQAANKAVEAAGFTLRGFGRTGSEQ